MKQFKLDSIEVPAVVETLDFRLRMLTVNDVVKDYDAVMSSVEHLQGVLDPDSAWPQGLSFEQDLIDLGWHQKEFQTGRSFAYTVMNLDESQCLGCVYIYPSQKSGYDAQVTLWVRQSEISTGLDEKLFSAVKSWLTDAWWFKTVAFPGREIHWHDWLALADQ